MSSASTPSRITGTTQQVVDTVLAHVGAGKGGPHTEIEAQLRELVDAEAERTVHDFAIRIREALDQSVYDSMEGEMAARAVLREVLGPEPNARG